MDIFIKKCKLIDGKVIITNMNDYTNYLNKYIYLLTESQSEVLINNKIICIRDFLETYRYDLENEIYPRALYGYYKNKEEYENIYRKKVLIDELANFIGTIFLNYHIRIYNKLNTVPIYGFKHTIFNSLELYSKVICDYYRVLYEYQGTYRLLKTGQLYGNPTENYNDEVKDSDFIDFNYKNHSILSSFIVPCIIEEMLKGLLQNKLIVENFSKLSYKNCKIREEQIWYKGLETFYKRKSFCGNKYDVFVNFYKLFVCQGLINDNDEYKALITGYKRKNIEITLGYILNINFIDKYIDNNYLEILKLLYGSENLNLRNVIMHGDDENFDIYNINLLALQIQLLWDIFEGDIFV